MNAVGLRLRHVVAEHCDDMSPDAICVDHELQQHLGLDDLERMDLLLAIEEEFDVSLDDDVFLSLHFNANTTVQQLLEAVERLLPTTKATA